MSKKIQFTKMHGAGNDYIYINVLNQNINNPHLASVQWSDRHKGIGSDGLVLIGNAKDGDFSMRIFNADGSEAMMCGNATRCIGKYLYEKGLTQKTEIKLSTLSGIKTLYLNVENGNVKNVTVDMGISSLINFSDDSGTPFQLINKTIKAGEYTFKGTAVSMGNPHLVLFVDEVEKLDITKIGPLFEHHPLFPDRVNVEFAQILNNNEIRMRVWERGSGITMACGTGACATAVAAFVNRYTQDKVTIHMDGGSIQIAQDAANQHVMMTGGATTVFEGEIDNDIE
jgi:diaminopimelate epimerase